MEIRIKRIYAEAAPDDGMRILVDRLWPRGLSKEKAGVDFWAKELAPSAELRRWYGHEPERWPEFKDRYYQELEGHPEAVKELLHYTERGLVTFLYSSKEERLNNAVALKEYLESLK